MTRVAAASVVLAALSVTGSLRGQGLGSAGASIATRATIDPRQDIAFRALVVPDTVYVGQQATYQVGVFLSDEIRARLRRNPEFVPPEVRSMLAFELPSPAQVVTRRAGTRAYDVHVFQRALFPLTAGVQVIPSARLNYALPLSNSFFAREESHTETSGPVTIVAREPPREGRPAEFRGAVGRVSVSAHLDGRRARVGDPLTFTLAVDAVGNVSLFPRPDLRIAWADVVSGGEKVELDTSAVLLRGRKEFEWIVTPRQDGSVSVPSVRYAYFNPYTERYEIAVTRPETVVVARGEVAARGVAQNDSVAALPVRRTYRGEAPRPLPSRTGYWLLVALAPLPAVVLTTARRPARARPVQQDAGLRALAASDAAANPASLRRAFSAAIATRMAMSPSAMADHVRMERTLRRGGVSDTTAKEATALLAELDAAVFGRAAPPSPDAARRAHRIVIAIDTEARSRAALAARAARMVVILIVAAAASAAAAGTDAMARDAFAEGLRQYDARDFVGARQIFFDLALARPRAADAWANFGTAAWQAHDTAAAAIGWQRAARLEPGARDVRQNLRRTPGFRDGWLGDIPPVSLTVLGVVGMLAWLAGWAVATWRLRQRRPYPFRAASGFLATAALLALAGVVQRDTLGGRRVAIVVHPSPLRAEPALAAEAGALTITGEAVRVQARQGVWTRVRLSDGRRGWLESARLQALGVEEPAR